MAWTGSGLVVLVTRNRLVPITAVGTLAAHAESLNGELPEGRFTAAAYKNRARVDR